MILFCPGRLATLAPVIRPAHDMKDGLLPSNSALFHAYFPPASSAISVNVPVIILRSALAFAPGTIK